MRSLVRIATLLTLLLATAAVTAFILVRQPSLGRSANLVTNHASATRLEHDVRWLTAEPRSADHPETLDKVADYLATEFARSGAVVTRQPFRARGRVYQNVIASFGPGSAPVLIVGAHYDVFSARRPLPGADDNASGPAGLLELARLLQHETLQRRVDLVAYTNEEPPFFGSDEMGSAIHAASIHGARLPPMISLE